MNEQVEVLPAPAEEQVFRCQSFIAWPGPKFWVCEREDPHDALHWVLRPEGIVSWNCGKDHGNQG